jgi:NodT family efflux transporter outer membrane factor (OMF) lipoprotein
MSLDTYIKHPTKTPINTVQIEEKNKWWQVFQDPLMNTLITELLSQNIDIQIAKARIIQARGIERSVNSGFFPDISLSAESSRSNKQIFFDKPISITQGGFDAAWEIDIFGQTKSALKGAKQRVNAQIATTDDVTNSVIAELMHSIIQWRKAQQTIKETVDLLAIQDSQISLIATRSNAGLIDATFLSRAKAEHAQTATRLPIAQAALDTAEYKIELLLGKKSGTLSDMIQSTSGELTVPNVDTALDISLDHIRNRPDIRASYAELLATKSDLKLAKANLWPRITLRSFFGVQDSTANAPFATFPIWSLASGVTAPLFNFGKLQGAIDSSKATVQLAILSYKNTSLRALQEAKTALSDYLNGINATHQQLNALNYRKEALHLATQRFTYGLTDKTDVTTAQSELNEATVLYIDRQAETAIAYVRLHKALGTSISHNEVGLVKNP